MGVQIAQTLPLVMTTAEVAEVLRCSANSVARYVYAHELLAIRIGRERRFRAVDVIEFVARRPNTIKAPKRRPERPKTRQGGVSG